MPRVAPDAPDRSPPAIRFLFLALLAAFALMSTAESARRNRGIDFFNLWGVPAALSLTGHGLDTPYRNGDAYLAALKDHGATSGDSRLLAAAAAWPTPDFTATPLLYTMFAVFSPDYDTSLGVFRILQVGAFILTFALLGWTYGLDLGVALALALIMLVSYQPLLADLRVVNLGCLQFGLLGGLVVASRRVLDAEDDFWRATLGGLLLVALIALTLAKPNVVLITGLLAAHVALRLGRRLSALVALPVVAATVALLAVPCLYFGSSHIWSDWYQFVYGTDAHMLVRSLSDGNYSTVVLLSSFLGTDVFQTSLGLIGLLGASFVGAVWWTSGTAERSRSLTAAVTRIVRHLAASPEFALTVGIAATMAISPLFWVHYFMLAVIPCLWLLATPFPSTHPARLAVLAMLLSSAIPGMLLGSADSNLVRAATVAASWVPLWAAVIIIAKGNSPADQVLA